MHGDSHSGTDIDLIKMRNPWGKGGEIDKTKGLWADDGSGGQAHPEVKAAINPTFADDGIFFVSKEEFSRYFGTLYLCASDLGKFVH